MEAKMTATEKYLNMNNLYCKFRDAIFESDVDEKDEGQDIQDQVKMAMLILNNYLDYYKELNNCKTKEK